VFFTDRFLGFVAKCVRTKLLGLFAKYVRTNQGVLTGTAIDFFLGGWVGVVGSSSPDVDKKQQPEIFEFDHIYPSGSEDADFSAVLYGSYGVPCFARFHSLLVAASKQVVPNR
jgi:hypothetical protein